MDKKRPSLDISVICHVDMSSLNAEGIQIVNFAKALKSLGHNIELIAPKTSGGDNFRELPLCHMPRVDIEYLRPLSLITLAPFFLMKHFARKKPDAVICFDLYGIPTIIPTLKLLKIPVLLYLNSIIGEDMKALGRNPLTSFIAELSWNMNVSLCDFVSAVSEPVRNYAVTSRGKKYERTSVIRDAVDTSLFHPIEKDQARKELKLDPRHTYIGFVGSLCAWHGLEYLFHAAPEIISRNGNIRFLIVGDGEMRNPLEKLSRELGIGEYIIWTGFVSYEQIPRYISAFDLCIAFFKMIRSNYGSPMKVFEYLSCERPVVASNCPEYGEFVESIDAGISVDHEKTEELAQRITDLLADPERAVKMGKSGRQAILEKHRWENRAKEFCEGIFKIIGKNG